MDISLLFHVNYKFGFFLLCTITKILNVFCKCILHCLNDDYHLADSFNSREV